MTDEDARLRRLLARAAQSPEDDAFVDRVQQQIKRTRRTKRLVATGVVLALVASFAVMAPMLLDVGAFFGQGAELAMRGAAWVLVSPTGGLLGLVAWLAYAAVRHR